MRRIALALGLGSLVLLAGAAPAGAAQAPEPGSPEYVLRDAQNIVDAYGRQLAADGQLSPAYISATLGTADRYLGGLGRQLREPLRPALTPGQLVPGWDQGNPFRADWAGSRGIEVPVAFTNRYGALLRGHVYAPLPGARDPYTDGELDDPLPAVVITTGSIQGSEGMYTWLAQDLAERGYLVLTYDVQGQGSSETLPHLGDAPDLPFCNPVAEPAPGEMTGCPGVPSQQDANFVVGTEDALDFVLATPERPYSNPQAGSAAVNDFNPLWARIDRRRDPDPLTPGRDRRVAIVGHSLGAAAISQVQGVDERVMAAVALDKLEGDGNEPAVPALAVQSEYGFTVAPYWMMDGPSFLPGLGSPAEGPDPRREQRTGFDAWRDSGIDTALIVPRASTHLEYTDIPFALPASRYGQALTSHYVQAWLDKYLKRDPGADRRLLADRITYLEPNGDGRWAPTTLDRAEQLSFYFCSGFDLRLGDGSRHEDLDPNGVGC